MSDRYNFYSGLIIFLIINFVWICEGHSLPQTRSYLDKHQKVIYYGTWSGYNHPLKPSTQISKERTKKLPAYYIGYYDNGILYRFEKYLHGELVFKHDYEYYSNGKLRKRISGVGRMRNTYYYDESGRLMKKNQ